MKKYCSVALLLLVQVSFCQTKVYEEKYRPRFHFSPMKNWTNDPNGLVYYAGEYHLFYQYNPYGNRWGHMSWGHSVSSDLVHWKNLPLAIPEGKNGMIFSGGAVVDEHNTAGFGNKDQAAPMVAIYTGHLIPDTTQPDQYLQSQHIAYSTDKGRTWTKYSGNPVLDLHKKDFRDPCVIWYAPQKKWVMAAVFPSEHIVKFFGSPDLKHWTHLSDFGPAGDTKDIWECSSIVEVPVEGMPGKKKWVLFNSQQTTMQYFVGSFDGTNFKNENPADIIYRPDYGPDYYAGITYQQLPSGQNPVLVGWANNWRYANDIPTFPWKGMFGLPRRLSLKKYGDSWILLQHPVSALQSLREAPWHATQMKVESERVVPVQSQQCEISLAWTPTTNTVSGIKLALKNGKSLTIGYDASAKKLFMDRTGLGEQAFNPDYPKMSHYEAKFFRDFSRLSLDIYFDHSIVEVFANDGEVTMSMQLFVDESQDGIQLFSDNGTNNFDNLSVWKLKSAW